MCPGMDLLGLSNHSCVTRRHHRYTPILFPDDGRAQSSTMVWREDWRVTSLALCQSIESRLESSLQGWRSRLDGLDQVAAVEAGQGGRAWSDDKIFKALLLAVLSNNTDWSKIERIQVDLADLFFGFSLKLYAELPACQIGNHILPWFLERKAGSVTLERDLVNLIGAVRLLFEHSCAHGNAESYITSLVQEFDGDPKQAALHLGSPGHYKLSGVRRGPGGRGV